jgi:hypothetical protein
LIAGAPRKDTLTAAAASSVLVRARSSARPASCRVPLGWVGVARGELARLGAVALEPGAGRARHLAAGRRCVVEVLGDQGIVEAHAKAHAAPARLGPAI